LCSTGNRVIDANQPHEITKLYQKQNYAPFKAYNALPILVIIQCKFLNLTHIG